MSKFFMNIETDNQKLIEEVWFENQENFDKYGCNLKFDTETSSKVAKEWSEKVKD